MDKGRPIWDITAAPVFPAGGRFGCRPGCQWG
jgi:hypothetical protein